MNKAPLRPSVPATKRAAGGRARSLLTVTFSLIAVCLTMAFVSVFSIGFTIVIGIFVSFIAFHYLVWGWWLGALLRAEEIEE